MIGYKRVIMESLPRSSAAMERAAPRDCVTDVTTCTSSNCCWWNDLIRILFSLCVCLCFQSEHHPGLPAQTETNRPVFSHSDAGAGEAGEGRPQEPGPHHREGERRSCHRRPENTFQTLQLLHGESARSEAGLTSTSPEIKYSHYKRCCHFRSAEQKTSSTAWSRFWGNTSMRRTWSSSGTLKDQFTQKCSFIYLWSCWWKVRWSFVVRKTFLELHSKSM